MIIGIHGLTESGKDTVGAAIQYWTSGADKHFTFEQYMSITHIPHDWKVRKFAEKLKQIASLVLNIPLHKFEDQEFKKTTLGEEWRVYYVRMESAINPLEESTKRVSQYYASEQEVKNDWFKGWGTVISEFEIASEILTVRKFLQLLGTEACRVNIHPNFWINSLMSEYNKDDKWIITDLRFKNEYEALLKRDAILVKVERPGTVQHNHPSETELKDVKFENIIYNNSTLENLANEVRSFLVKNDILKSKILLLD